MSIVVSDDFFDINSHRLIFEFCQNALYEIGETDMPGGPITGMISNISPESSYYSSFDLAIRKDFKQVEGKRIFRMYINLFTANENPHFHTDSDEGKDAKTFLYYPNLSWDMNDGGETQFLVNDEIIGVLPKPNRLVMFDAEIWHKATSFRDRPRYTIAVKYI